METRTKILVLLGMILVLIFICVLNRNSIHELRLAQVDLYERASVLKRTQKGHTKDLKGLLEVSEKIVSLTEKLSLYILREKP